MSKDKNKIARNAQKPRPTTVVPGTRVEAATPGDAAPPTIPRKPPFFRRCDWISFGVTTLLTLIGYLITLAPDLTLEDSGELAVGSYYAGVPHPPGYPVWTIYTWLFTVLVPFSNIAWRVALSSAVAAALANGFLALIASRGSSMILESIEAFKNIDRKIENWICIVAGWVAGMLIGFNGFMWSQAVIVEVYTLSVFTLVLTLVFLLRWLYEPERVRWLLWAFFLFGLCFTNHQTLICAAMGIEVLICFAHPRLGRDLLLGNVLAYTGGLLLRATGLVQLFEGNVPVLIIFHVVGLFSLAAYGYLVIETRKPLMDLCRDIVGYAMIGYLLSIPMVIAGFIGVKSLSSGFLYIVVGLVLAYGTWWLFNETRKTIWDFISPFLCGVSFLAGASFYLYMPLASMTNPPMNWGYPRTVDGFIHAFTRGQYEKTNPTESIGKFFQQIDMLFQGALSEFNGVFLMIAIVPFIFMGLMKARERAWLIGQIALYLCLSFLLIYLLNPNADKQSHDLTKVFFTASHVMVALCVGYGLTLISAMLVVNHEKYRNYLLYGGLLATLVALFGVISSVTTTAFALDRLTAYFGLVVMVAVMALILANRQKVPILVFLGLAAVAPTYSVFSHWAQNEQRGHLFGWYFGHDMFTPPFTAPDGSFSYDPELREQLLQDPEKAKLVYPEMAKNAILFGGTDPGRFAPTYMIFCESQIPPEKRRDPNFDRSDVYIITQNALADHTYLSYIRAHYNRSTQIDPPFFQELLRPEAERTLNVRTNWLARNIGGPLDDIFIGLGEKIEKRRREEGVYPKEEIYCPTPMDSKLSFETYLQDAGRRKKLNQLKPGEQVDVIGSGQNEKIQVAGQVAVMAINALLCKVIFDNNPTNEFYIEESFPLDWMFPYLTPYGIIMKINREPVGEFSEELYQRDRHFWKQYSDRLIGNWITEQTTVDEICDYAEKVFLHHDYSDYEGDPKFIRDDQAQKSFSKLRGGIAGLYAFKAGQASMGTQAQQRAVQEAEFAYKQSFAFCPYSPEAAFKYASLLANIPGRLKDALRIAETAYKLDPLNEQFEYLVTALKGYVSGEASLPQAQEEFTKLAAAYQANPMVLSNIQGLIVALAQMGDTNQAFAIMQQTLASSNLVPDVAVGMAMIARELRNIPIMEQSLMRLTEVNAGSPEAWYDLSALQASLGKFDPAMTNLRRAVLLNDQRLRTNPAASDLRIEIGKETRFAPLRSRPDWEAALAPAP